MRGWKVWAALLLGLLIVLPGYAQDSQQISYGETIQGTLTADSFRDLYTFRGRVGEIITIRMQVTPETGNLDPYLSLVNGSGQGVAFSDDNDGNNAVIDSLRLPADGDYFLIATRFGHAQGSTTGDYSLSIELIGTTSRAGSALQFGDTLIGEITSESPQVAYTFQASRGDVVNLRMERTSGNLDPYLDLANSRGQIIYSSDDDPTAQGTLNAGILNYTIQTDGVYIIVATRYGRDAGNTQGSYLLTIENIPESQRGLAPTNAILIDYDDTINASLDGETPQRFYVFEGQRGDVVSLQVNRLAGNLVPVVMLLDSTLTQLTQDGDSPPYDRARINAYTLPSDSVYYVMVSRAGFAEEGTTAGDFALVLNGRAGITGGQYLEIFYDTAIEGAINDILPYESFVFQGEAGDIVTIRMDTLAGDLDALLTLYLNGKQIAFDDDSGDNKNAAIIGFRLQETGIYRVEASRFNREGGNTSGEYRLQLEVR